jgi:hypothetical protein
MSDEQRTEDEVEVEGHLSEVSAAQEPAEDDDAEDFEAHLKLSTARME